MATVSETQVPATQNPVTENQVPATQNQNVIAMSKYSNDKTFEMVSKAGNWLPRMQLFSSSSNICKAGKFPLNHYGLVVNKDQVADLGAEVIGLALSWRPKALRIDGDSVIIRYNPDSPEFQEIAEKSKTPNSFCMYGPEFLFWLSEQDKLATFFLCSKSARREAPNLRDLMEEGSPVLLKSRFIQTKQYSWQGILIEKYNGPDLQFLVDEWVDEITRFSNPPETEQMADDSPDRDR